MQYLVSVIDDMTLRSDTELATGTATPTEEAAIDGFNARLQAEGHWVFAAGLGAATGVDNRGERTVITDGPFAESKEYLAGFWIMEAPDLDAVLALATEGSRACNRKLEVRPVLTES